MAIDNLSSLLGLLAACSTLVAANGQGQQPMAAIGYTTALAENSTTTTQILEYTNWNQNMTLSNISATSMIAYGGNAAADLGYSCVFASGGNPGGIHTISLHGGAVDLATNPVDIKWICCGDCATKTNLTANNTTSVTSTKMSGPARATGTGASAANGNSTTLTPASPSNPSALPRTNDNAGISNGLSALAILGAVVVAVVSMGF